MTDQITDLTPYDLQLRAVAESLDGREKHFLDRAVRRSFMHFYYATRMIDLKFGEDYSKKNPHLVAALLGSMAK